MSAKYPSSPASSSVSIPSPSESPVARSPSTNHNTTKPIMPRQPCKASILRGLSHTQLGLHTNSPRPISTVDFVTASHPDFLKPHPTLFLPPSKALSSPTASPRDRLRASPSAQSLETIASLYGNKKRNNGSNYFQKKFRSFSMDATRSLSLDSAIPDSTKAADSRSRSLSLPTALTITEEADETVPSPLQKRPSFISQSIMDILAGKGASRRLGTTSSYIENGSSSEAVSQSQRPASSSSALDEPQPTWNWSNLTGFINTLAAFPKHPVNSIVTSSHDEATEFMSPKDTTPPSEPDWSTIKASYKPCRFPVVFAHGLFGFDYIGPASIPSLQVSYWRGVREALEEIGVEVLITSVPASASIEERAKKLCEQIEKSMEGREVNLIGHSMGGLDGRYLISQLQPTSFKIRSLTTIATPHRGSSFADYVIETIVGRNNMPALMSFMDKLQIPGGGAAFDNLTTTKMARFNDTTPDVPSVKYFSYGACFEPGLFDVFRTPWKVVMEHEGENDGLVSVSSSKWGQYLGTLEHVNHLDLVGWVGKIRYTWADITGNSIKFKPVSFYLSVVEMLEREGF